MDAKLKQTIWFYTGADYLVINAFLWKNTAALNDVIQIVWNNNRAVIGEAQEQTPQKRFESSGLDGVQLYESYLARTPEALTPETQKQILEQAARDARCICRGMKPAPKEILLIRNIGKRCVLQNTEAGQTIRLLGLTSTSTTGQLIDYGKDACEKPEQIARILIPEGFPMLTVEDERENEVILPPAVYRMTEKRKEQETEVLCLQALTPLDVEQLIEEALKAV